MQQRRKIRYLIAFVLLTAGILVLLLCNIGIGTVEIPLTEILTTGRTKEGMNARILWEIRLPRTLAAGILGGALALAGYLLQTFFHNPIAGPFVLGISSGAKMVVALVMVFLLGNTVRVSSGLLILAAFLGAMLSMGFVLLMARKVEADQADVHAGGQRRDDRLHLFCHYGTGGDFCGGCGYRESPQLVERKLFRNDLGQCESDEYRGGSDFTYGDPVSKAAGSLPAG